MIQLWIKIKSANPAIIEIAKAVMAATWLGERFLKLNMMC